MPDKGDRKTDGTRARVVPGSVLDRGGAVVRRRQLEELDRARRDLAAAEASARELLVEARHEAEQQRALGYEAGLAQAREETAMAAVALRAEATRVRAEAGDRLIRLAVELAQQVLHQELRTAPDAVESIARSALAEVSWCQQITLRLNPDDARNLAEAKPRLAEALDPGTELRLETDPTLAPGACVVETEAGNVDASVEVQLAALERALLADSTAPPTSDAPNKGDSRE